MTIEECQIAMDEGKQVCVVHESLTLKGVEVMPRRVDHVGKIVTIGVGDNELSGFRGMVGIHVGAGVIYYARPGNIHLHPLQEALDGGTDERRET